MNEAHKQQNADDSISPRYEKSTVSSAIVHIGVGAFHRAHMAMYCDKLLEMDPNSQWKICGVGLMPEDKSVYRTLESQKFCYSLMTLNKKPELRIVAAIENMLLAEHDPRAIVDKLCAPETKIISLTITEGGYPFNQADQSLDKSNKNVAHDLEYPHSPKSAFGFILYAMLLRKSKNMAGVTILSCDNVPGNGDVTKKVLLAFAENHSEDLYNWIVQNVSFPNSMVDRITPVTTREHKQDLFDAFGLQDNALVVCEKFSMWVLEDKFKYGRPNFESVGVQFTDDVSPYEEMKLSLLNATHSAMAYLGILSGMIYSYEVIEHQGFKRFLSNFMDIDVTPVLKPVPNIDLTEYKASLFMRFGNRYCADSIERLCMDGSGKLVKFLIPTIEKMIERKMNLMRVSLIVASWVYYLQTSALEQIRDPRAHELKKTLADDKCALEILNISSIFGSKLTQSKGFIQQYRYWLEQLAQRGSLDIINKYYEEAE